MESAAETVQNFVLLENWRSAIDIVALMQADPNDCLERENRDKLIEKTGRAMNADFLAELNSIYASVATKFGGLFDLFVDIDTSTVGATSLEDAARTVVDLTLGMFEAKM